MVTTNKSFVEQTNLCNGKIKMLNIKMALRTVRSSIWQCIENFRNIMDNKD